MDYEHISEEDKITIITNQLKQMEGQHFSLSLVEPSRLQEEQQHMVWRQQIMQLEKSIELLRKSKSKLENG